MWLKLVLLALVAFAWGDHNPAWKHKHVYEYEVRGRISTSLNLISHKHSGIFLKALLTIRSRPDGNLGAQITSAQYADIHSKLPTEWSLVSDSHLSYKSLPLSSKPFKMIMVDGVLKDLVLQKGISNWEVNMVKGIVTQLQWDTKGKNEVYNPVNNYDFEHDNAVYTTMEETVTGETETLYEIHSLPEYVLLEKPFMLPLRESIDDVKYLEIVKTRNFTESDELLSYHFGLDEIQSPETDNQIGKFFTRSAVSQAILSGSLTSFTLHNIITTEEIIMKPNLVDRQTGSTKTLLNLTLITMREESKQFEEPSTPINVGITYRYDQPFQKSNRLEYLITPEGKSSEESDWVQEQPKIEEAPASPLLPFTVGYDGQAITMKQNVKKRVIALAKQIGQEFLRPEIIPKENTLGKFLVLTSLLRVLNYPEMKQIGEQLHSSKIHGEEALTWLAYRDAVAQTGTGPALLTIQTWILNSIIFGNQASQMISTAATAVRQPTEKYMKVFFGMIQNEKIMRQPSLNESLLLSFTRLTYQVYVNKEVSRSRYPVHSFGTFNTLLGRVFVKQQVLPYLATKLQRAIQNADTQQIHVYIRAIGNVGHRGILKIFKPYLEGTKKVSQFQRVLMVLALENLIKHDRLVAQSVLYKLYQNVKELEQLRVTAVYQLVRTYPSRQMFQKMALATNYEPSRHVKSAVKSTIQQIAKFSFPRYAEHAKNAKLAEPLLTPEEFGIQYCKQYLQMYIVDEMQQLGVKQVLETHIGEDSVVPKSILYVLRGEFNGYQEGILKVEALVSSIDDLVNVVQEQTSTYQRLVREKQAFESVKTKGSSENTAQFLNLQNEQREQLESYLHLHIGTLQKVWSFDNRTVENLTEVVKELENELKSGKHMHYHKMAVHPELTIALPTILGLPYIYTYDRPVFVHFENDIKGHATPSVSTTEGLQTPQSLNLEMTVYAMISARTQSQLGFFAPFNSKRYSAGYDKNFQLQLPTITGKAFVDIKNKQLTVEIENGDKKPVRNLLHFSTWPYITQYDILTLKPDTDIIRKENPFVLKTALHTKHTGLALSLNVVSDRLVDSNYLYERLSKMGSTGGLLSPWIDDNIQHVEFNLDVDILKSTNRKLIIHLGQQSKDSTDLTQPENLKFNMRLSEESWQRQKELLRATSKGISSVKSAVLDAVVLFEGQKTIKYTTTFASGSSSIDPKGRLIWQAEKHNIGDEPIKIQLIADSKVHHPPTLTVGAALEFDPTTTVEVKGILQEKSKTPTEVILKLKLEQSEERKEYLTTVPEYKKCFKKMIYGNYQLPSCEALIVEANLLDKFNVTLEHHNLEQHVANTTYTIYGFLRHLLYPRLSESLLEKSNSPSLTKKIYVEGQFSPSLLALNASVNISDYARVEVENIEITPLWRQVLVFHPLYSIHERLSAYLQNSPTSEPYCLVDKRAINTFDNKTYHMALSQDWSVLLQYVPRFPSSIENKPYLTVVEQLKELPESWIVYVRASGQSTVQKEVKLVIQSPYTLGKVVEILLKPSQGGYPKLYVQSQEVSYTGESSETYDSLFMQVYKLPNYEVKLELYDGFEIIYDGIRAKIVMTTDKFRDASRGLCGTFDGAEETDFTDPGNCILQDSQALVSEYTISANPRTKRMEQMSMVQDEEKTCYQKSIGYVTVVSNIDIKDQLETLKSMIHTIKYVDVEDLTCFTLNPIPVCKSGYRQRSITKMVPVHCVKSSNLSDMMKKQIDLGANPLLGHKPANREVLMNMAESCEM